MRELALFAGAGGGILGGLLHGWRTVAAIEIEDYPRRILLQRQADGILPRFPIWDDVRTFNGFLWREKIDIITGGFPCQDISAAGKGKGLEGERSGLWKEMARVIREVQPRHVLVENSEMLIWRGLETVIDDLSSQGYGGKATVIPALFVSGTHIRNRLFILADSKSIGWKWVWSVWSEEEALEFNGLGEKLFRERANESGIVGTGYGISHRVDRLKAIGNGQVPACAAIAFMELCPLDVLRLQWEDLCENVKDAEKLLKRKPKNGNQDSGVGNFAMWRAQTLVGLFPLVRNIAEKRLMVE